MKFLFLLIGSLLLLSNAHGKEPPAPVTDCDRLLVLKQDKDTVYHHEKYPYLEVLDEAFAACGEAIKRFPNERRLLLRYGLLANKLDKEGWLQYVEKAGELGSTSALEVLISFYENPSSPNPIQEKKLYWVKKAAELDIPEMRLLHAHMLIEGKGTKPDPEKGASIIREMHEQGFVQASMELARLHFEGKGVDLDIKKAVSLIQRGTEQDYPPAFVFLGQMYLGGLGVDLDEEKGLALMRKGYELGWQNAATHIGLYYWQRNRNTDAQEWLCKTEWGQRIVNGEDDLSCLINSEKDNE